MEPETLVASPRRIFWRALGPGLAGSLALTALHESSRRVLPGAPRMDVLGKRALKRSFRKAGLRAGHGRKLHRKALAGDLVSNGLYYSLVAVGRPRRPYVRGLILGIGAGLGAVLMPGLLRLGRRPIAARPWTPLLTVAWYLTGGLVAAGVTRRIA